MVRERQLQVGGIRLWLATAGDRSRPALLMLHGLYDRWETWEPVLPALAERFWVLAPDLRGHARSDWPLDGYRLADYASDAAGLLDTVARGPARVVGFSLGALVGVVLTGTRPELVELLVLEDPPLAPFSEPARAWLSALLDAKRAGQEAAYELARELHPERDEAEWRRESAWLCETADGPFLTLLQGEHQPDPWTLLPSVTCPTLLLQADPLAGGALDDESAARALAALPRGRLVRFPETGHAIHRERPAGFVETVLGFLGSP
jgi:pimeloyl-ACP methyl ester carboxylesterase